MSKRYWPISSPKLIPTCGVSSFSSNVQLWTYSYLHGNRSIPRGKANWYVMGRRTVGVSELSRPVPVAYIQDGHWPDTTIATAETSVWHKGSTTSRIIGLQRGNSEHSDAKKYSKKYPIKRMKEMFQEKQYCNIMEIDKVLLHAFCDTYPS
jgi:hypothetical protein